MDSYPCSTDVIATFYYLSDSDTAIGRYLNRFLIILLLSFFFNKKIMYILFGSAFEFYHEVCNVLFEYFNLSFGICCLALVTKCCLDFFNKTVSVLNIVFFYA